MSDQLAHPLYGQYSFTLEADRLATLANLGLGNAATLANQALGSASTALTDGATVAIDWSASNTFTLTSATTTTISFTNTTEKSIKLALTGGASSAITWPTILWQAHAAPTSPASGKHILIQFTKVGTAFYGAVLVNDT